MAYTFDKLYSGGSEEAMTAFMGDCNTFAPNIEWGRGSLSNCADDNREEIYNKRIRTKYRFDVKKGDTILLSDNEKSNKKGTVKFCVHLADKVSGNFVKDSGWRISPYVIDSDDYQARILCAYTRETDIYDDEIETLGANIIFKALGQRNVDIDILQEHIDRRGLPNMFVMAHRGYTDNGKYPDNSMAAFDEAVKRGYKFIETDVRYISGTQMMVPMYVRA